MNFEPTETQALVRKSARDFAERVVRPIAASIDAEERVPPEVIQGLGALGLLAVNVAPELGGAGAGPVAFALAIQEIARACASTAVTMSVTNMVGEAIARFGTPEQAARYCPALASGGAGHGCFALSEPDAGSDPGGMTTLARRDGTGDGAGWVIDGAKQWISGGNAAHVFIVWARTAGADGAPVPGTRGITCFLVDAGTPGLHVGKPEDKMGIRGSNTVPLAFRDCRVPASARLGAENEGFKIAMMALDGGRIGISSQAIGIARAALEESVAYARDRRTFGVPIAEHQAIQWMLADMRTRIDAAHLLSMRAAAMKGEGARFSREAAMAKLFASETAIAVTNAAVQVHGGYGYTREFAAERHLRDARVTAIYEGTSEIQRLVIARAALG
ncbi:MAG TPA: acyl-CoA dehydrogenase family protein [Polyangiaceae bacterium]|nr:acyl-CoA dehydrogenase family protein [Polyangiaceae bacterium]